MKTIATFDGITGKGRVVKVRWYSDLEEYVCEVTEHGKRKDAQDYYTNDKNDALETAQLMARD